MTIVGMAIVLVQLWREVGPLRAAVIRLRNEVGVLSVGDQKELHAIQVDTKDELTWRWRVWIPQGMVYVLLCTGEEIPKEGFPLRDCSSIWLREPGEQVIEYRIRRDPRDEKWYGSLHTSSGSAGKSFQPWVDWPNSTSTNEGGGRLTKASEPGKPLVFIAASSLTGDE